MPRQNIEVELETLKETQDFSFSVPATESAQKLDKKSRENENKTEGLLLRGSTSRQRTYFYLAFSWDRFRKPAFLTSDVVSLLNVG